MFSSFLLFFIFLALTANFIVDRLSCKSVFDKEQVVIMEVFVSVARESFKIRVSFELRYGTCSEPLVSA